MSNILTLASVGSRRLSQTHADYLRAAIERYQDKASRALKLAREAAGRGNRSLAAGLLDESATYHAMAEGLAAQQSNTEGESP